jgi:hypothetical protein
MVDRRSWYGVSESYLHISLVAKRGRSQKSATFLIESIQLVELSAIFWWIRVVPV